jgi:hypothetical protein
MFIHNVRCVSTLILFLYFIPNFLSPLYTTGGYITIVHLHIIGLYIVTTTNLCFLVVMCTTLTYFTISDHEHFVLYMPAMKYLFLLYIECIACIFSP